MERTREVQGQLLTLLDKKKLMAKQLLENSQGKLSNRAISEAIAKKYKLGLASYIVTALRTELGVFKDSRGGHSGPSKKTYASLAKAMSHLAAEYGIVELHYTESGLTVVQKVTRTVEFKR